MNIILKALYDYFCRKPKNSTQVRRIKTNHRLLIQRLSKRNRKLVLRSIDDKSQIARIFHLTASFAGSCWRGRSYHN